MLHDPWQTANLSLGIFLWWATLVSQNVVTENCWHFCTIAPYIVIGGISVGWVQFTLKSVGSIPPHTVPNPDQPPLIIQVSWLNFCLKKKKLGQNHLVLQKSESDLNIAKGITDPNGLNAFTTVTAVKGRVTLPKRIIFRKSSKGVVGWDRWGRGSFSIQKFMFQILDL